MHSAQRHCNGSSSGSRRPEMIVVEKREESAANYADSTTATTWKMMIFIFVTFGLLCFFCNPNLPNIRLPSKIVIALGRQIGSFGESLQVG
jgi:hypothetical protein